LIPIEKRYADKYHSLCGINGYLNLSKQSPKYEKSNTKILVMKRKPFRNMSKSKTSPGQPNPRNHYQKIIQKLETLGTLTTLCKTLALKDWQASNSSPRSQSFQRDSPLPDPSDRLLNYAHKQTNKDPLKGTTRLINNSFFKHSLSRTLWG
jgi:hypothetical protein